MSKLSMGLGLFLLEYRKVLAGLVLGLSDLDLAALLQSPIDETAKLLERHGQGALAERLIAITTEVSSRERSEVEEAIRAATEEVATASVTRAGDRIVIRPPQAAPPAAAPQAAPSAAAPAAPTREQKQMKVERGRPRSRGGDVLLGADDTGAEPPSAGAEPPPDQHQRSAPRHTGAGPGSAPPPAVDDAPEERPETRFLNAQIAGHEQDAPLVVAKGYVLEISVDLLRSGDGSARLPDSSLTHAAGEESIELMIQVTSEHFTVAQKSALPLELPRRGASEGKTRFDIKPRAAGRGTLTIDVHKQGNFLLQMELAYSIGAVAAEPVEQKVHGRSLTSASQLRKRDLGMTIKPVTGGYECVVRGSTYTSVILRIDPAKLADAITVARDAMLAVVKQRDDGVAVFQSGAEFVASEAAPDGTRVSTASEQKALATLARAGAALFQTLFYGRKAGADERAIGDLVRKCASKQGDRLTLQIVAESFPVPWGVLYLGSVADGAALSWEEFLGMRCIIEQIPLQTDMLVDDSVIPSDHPSLAVSVNVNAGIDEQYELDVVQRQLAFWKAQATAAGTRLAVTERQTRADVLAALSGRATEQLVYLYCHAVTNSPGDAGGITNSHFVFTGDERLTLADLDRESAALPALSGNPLVFINACESGELRPEFYDGFIPYFMSRGARGVIGTECNTPAVFATEWALRFFPRFLAGEPLGELFLDLRRELVERHGNPLGLLYNVYCDGDTQVLPGLTL